MKRGFFAALAAICLTAGTGAFAQNGNGNGGRSDRMNRERPTSEQKARHLTEHMTRDLGLNETQAEQVYELNLSQIEMMERHRSDMKAARETESAKMKTILTPEQYAQWSKLAGPEYGGHHHGRKGDCRKGGGRPDASGKSGCNGTCAGKTGNGK